MINISAEEAKLFQDNGFSKEQIGNTINHYRKQGLSDDEIQQKIKAKLGSFSATAQPKENKGIDLTPSGMTRRLAAATVAPFYGAKTGQGLVDAYKEVRNIQEEQLPKNLVEKGLDVYTSFQLPVLKLAKGAGAGAKIANNLATGAYQGGLIGGVQGLEEGKGLEGLTSGASVGGTVGVSLPYGLQKLERPVKTALENPKVQKGIAKTLEVLTSVPQKFSELALRAEIAGNSILKGKFDPETAYRGVERKLSQAKKALPTKESYKEQYKQLGEEAKQAYQQQIKPENYYDEQLNLLGQDYLSNLDKLEQKAAESVNKAIVDLPDDVAFRAGDIADSIDGIINKYSYSGDKNLNPAANMTKKEVEKIKGMLFGEGENRLGQFKQEIDNLKFPNGKLETIPRRYKNRYWTQSVDNLNNDITTANRRFNDEILGTLKEHPDWLNDPKKIEMLENHISKYTVPEEYMYELYNKFYEATGKGVILDVKNNLIKPKQLMDINKNIQAMTRWGDEGAQLQNRVLEQIYGDISGKLKKLSPDLEVANSIYEKLMNLEKQTGGLNASTIASKLKNYGNGQQILSGAKNAFDDIETLLPNEMGVLSKVQELNKARIAQEQLAQDLGNSLFSDISKYGNAPIATQTAIEKVAPDVVEKYKNLLAQQAQQDEILKPIMSSAYERNPRLLGNRTDEGAEKALEYLQNNSKINFMNELNNTRAREALEALLPGQGGGSGSAQGFGNLLRTSLIGSIPTLSLLTHNPLALTGFMSISPKFAGKGTIQNLGRIYQNIGKEIPEPIKKLMTLGAVNAIPLQAGIQYNDLR